MFFLYVCVRLDINLTLMTWLYSHPTFAIFIPHISHWGSLHATADPPQSGRLMKSMRRECSRNVAPIHYTLFVSV